MIAHKTRFVLAAVATALLAPTMSAAAQSGAPATLKLAKIVISGLQQCTEDVALESTGLKTGQQLEAPDLDR